MKIRRTLKFHRITPWFAGLLVWTLCVLIAAPAAWAAGGTQPIGQAGGTAIPPTVETPAATGTPKTCTECHPDVNTAWKDSPHAHAYVDTEFSERWKSLGEPGECLVCHTTGYSATTSTYTAEGVTCEACHGEVVADHPPAVVPIRADTEYCGTCHTTTLGEWRLTGHAAAEVGCSDCHNPHSQAALFENPDEMCINCHKDDIGEHQNDIHIKKDIGCVECHALVLPPETPATDGLTPTGHTFTITPATCVSCHTDTLHTGKPLPGYENGAKAVAASLPETSPLSTVVAEYTGSLAENESHPEGQTIQALEAALASARLSTLFQGGIIGLVLGGSTAYFIARNQHSEPKPGNDEEDDPQDTDSEAEEGSKDV